MKKSIPQLFREGIITNNPTFVQLLGMCPTLATTTSIVNALGMGVSVIVVLAFSNLFISLLRKIIPKDVRIASYIVIISGFVTAVELIIKAYFPSIDASLGLFIPLIVVNCIILARAEAFASKNGVLASAVDGVGMGCGFTLAITCIAIIRELLGNGTIFGLNVFGAGYEPMLLMILAPGGFMVFGGVLAISNLVTQHFEKKKKDEKGVIHA